MHVDVPPPGVPPVIHDPPRLDVRACLRDLADLLVCGVTRYGAYLNMMPMPAAGSDELTGLAQTAEARRVVKVIEAYLSARA